jgi:RimJ/RimL family protein N-acetyltransferase
VVLGTGAADFAAVFGELDRVGYRGPLIMQAWRDEEGVAVFARQLAWLQEKLARAKPIRPLVGPRIALHPFAERFITEEYLAWLRDAEVTRFIVKAGLDVTLPDVRAFCHRLIESPDDFFFAIVHDGRHIGNARLGPIDWSTGISGYGILIGDRSFHNRGFGAEVIELVSSFAFNELKLRALRFPVVEEHAAAMRLYRKCGFAEEGPWPEPFVRDGQSLSMTTFTKFSSRAA